MTRDPSDGSVKDTGARCSGSTSVSKTEGGGSIPPASASGLPTENLKADEIARLQRSREWLSKYRTDPESVMRRVGEQGGKNADGQD